MTDPAPLPPASAWSAEPWRRRLELLAVLLVTMVVLLIISAFVAARARLSPGGGFIQGFEQTGGLGELVRIAGSSAGVSSAGALLVAFLVVTLGPGDRIGRRGTFVLRALVVVGLFAAGLAVVSAVLTVTRVEELGRVDISAARVAGEGFIGRLSSVAPLLAAAVVSGFVAWCAFSTLGEAEPEAPAPTEPSD